MQRHLASAASAKRQRGRAADAPDAAAAALSREAAAVSEMLRAQNSALTGMFAAFLADAGLALPPRSLLQQQAQPQQPKRAREEELALEVTLEELFSGAVKRVPVCLQRGGTTVQQQLQVCVQPGLHEGTRITLPGLGSDDGVGRAGDLTFVVHTQLHPSFRRLADDLFAIVDVPLVTALTGGPVALKTLSGHMLQLPTGDRVIEPNSELVVLNAGMPYPDASGRRGALHVRFRVCFPSRLTPQQQLLLREALSGAPDDAAAQATAALTSRPRAGPRLLPANAGGGEAEARQQEQQQHGHLQQGQEQQGQPIGWRPPQQQQRPWERVAPWPHATGAGSSSASAAALATLSSSPHGACFPPAASSSAASSSSAAGFAVGCMQSTGSSRHSDAMLWRLG